MDLSAYIISPDQTIREAMVCIDRNRSGCALVTDTAGRLVDVVTDGDIRRALLGQVDPDLPLAGILPAKPPSEHPQPFTMPAGCDDRTLLELMRKYVLRQIPLVDGEGRPVALALLDDLLQRCGDAVAGEGGEDNLAAVVMAGGFGKRLRPYTETVPKPMLRVGDRPLLQHAITRLRDAGIRQVNVTVHYKKDVITEYFGDGSGFGVDIEYVDEDVPLGTAGAIAEIDHQGRTLLVMNGDILTTLDFRAMLDFHRQHKALITMAVAPYEVTIPYGLVEVDGVRVSSLVEKPVKRYFINTGIYLLEPEAVAQIPKRTVFNMTDLVAALMARGEAVVTFPVHEYWRDIGRPEDYEKANVDVNRMQAR